MLGSEAGRKMEEIGLAGAGMNGQLVITGEAECGTCPSW